MRQIGYTAEKQTIVRQLDWDLETVTPEQTVVMQPKIVNFKVTGEKNKEKAIRQLEQVRVQG